MPRKKIKPISAYERAHEALQKRKAEKHIDHTLRQKDPLEFAKRMLVGTVQGYDRETDDPLDTIEDLHALIFDLVEIAALPEGVKES